VNKGNVAPGLLGKRVQFCECPNPGLSLQYGTIVGSYVTDRLMLVVLFDNGKASECGSNYVTVQMEDQP
jgi:hypothetical protein